MKHLLNNLSEEEKQSILEQHNGGMKVFSENFKRLIGHKSGKILNEQPTQVGGRETITINKVIRLFYPNKPDEYMQSLTLKTVKTRGDVLDLTFDDPFSNMSNIQYKYGCTTKTIYDKYSRDFAVLGPIMQGEFNKICEKSMGVALTQKSGDVSGIA